MAVVAAVGCGTMLMVPAAVVVGVAEGGGAGSTKPVGHNFCARKLTAAAHKLDFRTPANRRAN